MAGEPTRWVRLEPRARDLGLAPGLEARVHDPLWLLGRQWQLGELTADGELGSAVVAQLTAEVLPLSRYRPGAASGGAATHAYDATAQPLEALVEAEETPPTPTARARARAGQHFERLLGARGMAKYVAAYRAAFPLRADVAALDAASRRFVEIVAGRVVDGARLRTALLAALRPASGAPALPATPPIAAADVAAVRAAADAWLAWGDALVTAPPATNAAWIADRMEYAFGLQAVSAGGAEATVEAEEYADGELEWHAFTALPPAAPATAGPNVVGPLTVVPSAVTYPGMPASRLWEFEDGRVDFGGVQADPEDLGRMLLAEFGLVFGGDWLLVPLEVAAGSLVRIVALDVRDTFGRTLRVGPTSALEGPSGGWRMFGISPPATASAAGPPADALLVAPALASSLQGRPLEDVLLLRDETANLVWAVERAVEGENGLPVDRAAAAYAQAPGPPPPATPADTLAYRLRSDVPEHWLPLIPQRLQASDPSMTLRLGALSRIRPDGAVVPIRPLGRLLAPATPDAPVVLREEEVPREGARVTRAYQLARWVDGTTFLWLGRRKAVGRGEGSSGLRFDTMETPAD